MEVNNQFIRMTEATLWNQNAAIKNLDTQMGQMVHAISDRSPCTLPSNTQVNLKEHVKAIITRSAIQLLEIHVKRLIANK